MRAFSLFAGDLDFGALGFAARPWHAESEIDERVAYAIPLDRLPVAFM